MESRSATMTRDGTWIGGGLAAIAFLWVYLPSMAFLVKRWQEDPGASHGPLVPLLAIVLLWLRRSELAAIPRNISKIGIGILGLGQFFLILATWADVQFLMPLSLVISVWGLVFYFVGWPFFKKIIFPMVFLLFAIPWPDFLVEAVSFPLQLWTSTYAAMAAGMMGLPVARDGVQLQLGKFVMEVAAPCSGIRSLVALMAIAAIFGYLLPAPMTRRATLFLAGIPIALVANTIRVTAIMLIAHQFGPKFALGFFHDYSSPFLFLLACLALMGLWKALECRTPAENQTL